MRAGLTVPYPHRTKACLRIYLESLSPPDVTAVLKLQPDTAFRAGDPMLGPGTGRPTGYIIKKGGWILDSKVARTEPPEHHIRWLIEQIEPSRDYLRGIVAAGGHIDIFLSLFGNDNFGWNIPPELVEAAGNIGITFEFEVFGKGLSPRD